MLLISLPHDSKGSLPVPSHQVLFTPSPAATRADYFLSTALSRLPLPSQLKVLLAPNTYFQVLFSPRHTFSNATYLSPTSESAAASHLLVHLQVLNTTFLHSCKCCIPPIPTASSAACVLSSDFKVLLTYYPTPPSAPFTPPPTPPSTPFTLPHLQVLLSPHPHISKCFEHPPYTSRPVGAGLLTKTFFFGLVTVAKRTYF